ncbi:vacuolar segregation protein Pep7p [Trichomonascus vanleenenianus]|uniref:phosphatidylinositol-3-phosphate binding protein n=1 Tax=Trichomonascus vanleenenianus TaxID=2268995 RepID=UPI003ECB3708
MEVDKKPRVFGKKTPVSLSSARQGSPSSIASESSDEGLSATLACPICNEAMVTLLQLNRHLDDEHSGVDKVENEQIKSWFMKKVEKARQLQSVTSVFHNGFSFDGLDEERGRPESPAPVEEITRKHWQKTSPGDRCSDILCDKILNSRNGSVNCRQCGKLFCSMHTKYQMKLSRKAKHDPRDGSWSRVCETCYKSRRGYNDHIGPVHDDTIDFAKMRQKQIDMRELEVNRLEKRLSTLIDTLSQFGDESGLLNYARVQQRRRAERSVASWQEDDAVDQCPICKQKFGFTLRKHHCRICGKVVCADHGTGCSRLVQLSVLSEKLEKGVAKVPKTSDLSIRMCRDCRDTVFAKKNFEMDLKSPKPALLGYYDALKRLKKAIELSLPKFQVMLQTLNDPENPPPHEILTEATAIRKKLLESFFQYEKVARKVLMYTPQSDGEKRLQQQVYSVAAQFLQDHLLPLKSLPKALKHKNGSATPPGTSSPPSASSLPPPPSVESMELIENADDGISQEIQNLQNQVVVLEEQKYMVEQMVSDAKSRRKLDEITALEQNLVDLSAEIDSLRMKLGQYDIA